MNLRNIKPVILYEGKYSLKDITRLKKENLVFKTVDIYERQLRELFEVNNPSLLKNEKFVEEQSRFLKTRRGNDINLCGNWVYFPWNGNLIHTINERDYFLLRTNRNRNLITDKEQQILYGFNTAVVGLSVGSNIAVNFAYQGIGKTMKLAEHDKLETSNLNRVRASISDIGEGKAGITAKQIYEINPYNTLHIYPKGLNKKNLSEFFSTDPVPDIIFEITDDFEMKILLRLEAKKKGIPVVMLANLGDSVLADIERYDLNKNIPLFNGVIGDLPDKILKDPKADANSYAVKIVGTENIPQRAIESVKEIGKTLIGRPQLSGTLSLSSSIACYIARNIALGNKKLSGRKLLSLDKIFI